MNAPNAPVFLDDNEPIDLSDALCVLREHLSETLDLPDITELFKD